MARIGVIGAGYVGLTTAACFTRLGHTVVCGRGRGEGRGAAPGAARTSRADLVAEGLRAKRLRFVPGNAAALSEVDFVFLCVPTPGRLAGARLSC